MWDIVAACGIVTSTVIVAGVVSLFVCMTINSVFEAAQDRKNDAMRERLHAELNQLDRWLSYDFPVVEEVSDYLREKLNESTSIGISEFRDGLRKKYGARVV